VAHSNDGDIALPARLGIGRHGRESHDATSLVEHRAARTAEGEPHVGVDRTRLKAGHFALYQVRSRAKRGRDRHDLLSFVQ
jgi:hypothetical protein